MPFRAAPVKIATLNSLRSALERASPESTAPGASEADIRVQRVLQKMQNETNEVGVNVFVAVNDRDASMMQSRMAEDGGAGRVLPAGGVEAQFGEGVSGGDILGWARSLFDHIDSRQWHPIARPADTTATPFADVARIAVIGDWGTNLYGAPVSAASIQAVGGYEMLLHLGDIYYSGTETETEQRFLDVWPFKAARLHRALNGNHEMYSGGFAYFDHVLPAFGQASSYFAFQNPNFLLIGLDTAHVDHELDQEQTEWVKSVIGHADARKVILFSHHQPFSRLDEQGPNLQAALSDLFDERAIAAWYWGHEHNCVLYDQHPRSGLFGRCIGHGGIPSPRKREVVSAPPEHAVNGIAWHRLAATADAPACLVLDGPNPLVPGEEEKFGPHGYLTLDFDGPTLVERVHLPDGAVIYEARVF